MIYYLVCSTVFWLCCRSSHASFLRGFLDAQYYLGIYEDNTSSPYLVDKCDIQSASFGPTLDSEDTVQEGCTFGTIPQNACEPVVKRIPKIMPAWCQEPQRLVFAVVQRDYVCKFCQMAWDAQQSNFTGVLISNIEEASFSPGGGDDPLCAQVTIPVYGISKSCGLKLLGQYAVSKGYIIAIRIVYGLDFSKYLIPLVVILAICFVIMLCAMIIRCVRDRRRVQRRRLSRRNLAKIPTKKYKKGDQPDVCPICLDDFVEHEKLRVLPCNHWYHCHCVDPWLTKNKKICPVCKRKVLRGGDSSDDSDAEQPARSATTPTGEEHSPLLSPTAQQIGNSTFYTNYHSTDTLVSDTEAGPSSLGNISSSSESLPVSRQGNFKVGRDRQVPLGFDANDDDCLHHSRECLVVPIPAVDEGRVNAAFGEQDSSADEEKMYGDAEDSGGAPRKNKAPRSRRRRHPAANRKAPLVRPRIVFDSESDVHDEPATHRHETYREPMPNSLPEGAMAKSAPARVPVLPAESRRGSECPNFGPDDDIHVVGELEGVKV